MKKHLIWDILCWFGFHDLELREGPALFKRYKLVSTCRRCHESFYEAEW